MESKIILLSSLFGPEAFKKPTILPPGVPSGARFDPYGPIPPEGIPRPFG